MPFSRQMTDEQRRAMFARKRGGSGAAGSPGGTAYDAEDDDFDPVAFAEYQRQFKANLEKTPGVASEFFSGMWEGAKRASDIGLNNLTFGVSDKIGFTHARDILRYDFGPAENTAYAVSDLLSTVNHSVVEGFGLGQLASSLGIASESVLTYPKTFLPSALKALEGLATLGKGMLAFRVGDAIDAFRKDRYMNPWLDKGLAVVGEASDIYGGYSLGAGFGKLLGAVMKIPLWGNQLVERTKILPQTLGMENPITGKVLSPKTIGDVLTGWAKSAGETLAKPFAAAWKWAAGSEAVTEFVPGVGNVVRQAAVSGNLPTLSNLAKEAYSLYTKAAGVTGGGLREIVSDGLSATAKVAGALMAGRFLAEGVVSAKTEHDAGEAFKAGETYTIEAAKPRGTLGTVVAAVTGTLGNPIEKMMRKGAWTPAQEEGVYRAKIDVVNDAYRSGKIDASERDSLLRQVATEKPRNLAGNWLYGVQSAMSKFMQWKGGEVASALGSSTLAKVQAEDREAEKQRKAADKARAEAERREAAQLLSTTFGVSIPETPANARRAASDENTSAINTLQTWLGSGLMYTGNSGVFSPMGEAGTGVAQTWNAALAVLGALDFNNRAAKSHDKTYTSPLQSQKPGAQKTEQQAAEEILRAVFGL